MIKLTRVEATIPDVSPYVTRETGETSSLYVDPTTVVRVTSIGTTGNFAGRVAKSYVYLKVGEGRDSREVFYLCAETPDEVAEIIATAAKASQAAQDARTQEAIAAAWAPRPRWVELEVVRARDFQVIRTMVLSTSVAQLVEDDIHDVAPDLEPCTLLHLKDGERQMSVRGDVAEVARKLGIVAS